MKRRTGILKLAMVEEALSVAKGGKAVIPRQDAVRVDWFGNKPDGVRLFKIDRLIVQHWVRERVLMGRYSG